MLGMSFVAWVERHCCEPAATRLESPPCVCRLVEEVLRKSRCLQPADEPVVVYVFPKTVVVVVYVSPALVVVVVHVLPRAGKRRRIGSTWWKVAKLGPGDW